MMYVHVVRLPSDLKAEDLSHRSVVVFDVLRATTSIVAALANGAREIRAVGSLDAAKAAWVEFHGGPKILAGEKKCLPPPGFDLGNSPGSFSAAQVAGKTIFLSTTNGTRAIVAAASAERLFAAALVNANATARMLRQIGLDVTLLCSGTEGEFSPDDFVGAGAVAAALIKLGDVRPSDSAQTAIDEFNSRRSTLPQFLRTVKSGHHILTAKLDADIDFAAAVDRFDIVAEIFEGTIRKSPSN